jgi:DNA-binding IclR family transcriptional regulator
LDSVVRRAIGTGVLRHGLRADDLATLVSAMSKVSAEELEVGLNAVAAPVHDANAQVIAALSVSRPSHRMGPAQFVEAAKQTIAAADAISRRLGWVERG